MCKNSIIKVLILFDLIKINVRVTVKDKFSLYYNRNISIIMSKWIEKKILAWFGNMKRINVSRIMTQIYSPNVEGIVEKPAYKSQPDYGCS